MDAETYSGGGCKIIAYGGSISSADDTSAFEIASGIRPLPDMFFGKASLTVHLQEVEISLNAIDAVTFSRYDSPESGMSPAIYRPPYDSLAELRKNLMKRSRVRQADVWSKCRDKFGFKVLEAEHDWSFTSTYWGGIKGCFESMIHSGSECRDDFLPNRIIRDSSIPVRYFKELHFWEDELADNGFSRMNVRLRVMDSFLYILMKFELRIDQVLDSRSVETRLFHEYGSGRILREFKWFEKREEVPEFRVNQILEFNS